MMRFGIKDIMALTVAVAISITLLRWLDKPSPLPPPPPVTKRKSDPVWLGPLLEKSRARVTSGVTTPPRPIVLKQKFNHQ